MNIQASPDLLVRSYITPPPASRDVQATRANAARTPMTATPLNAAAPEQATPKAEFLDLQRFVALMLLVAVLISALALVWAKHQSRSLLQELERLNAEHDELQIEWGRLQLEQATWSENARVEELATTKLGLSFPEQSKVVVIKQ